MYTCVRVYIHAHAYLFLQGNEPQPGSRRDSIDSQVSTVQSEQAQSLQRAGSKGLAAAGPPRPAPPEEEHWVAEAARRAPSMFPPRMLHWKKHYSAVKLHVRLRVTELLYRKRNCCFLCVWSSWLIAHALAVHLHLSHLHCLLLLSCHAERRRVLMCIVPLV